MTDSASSPGSEPAGYGRIAVIGAACRMPGAPTPDAFWLRLFEGQEFIRDFKAEEMAEAGLSETVIRRGDHVARAAVLEDVFDFDPELFGYSDQEAAEIDPQQRLFLACAHEALEQAGYGRPDSRPSVGVFGAAKMSTYFQADRESLLNVAAPRTFQALIGNDKDYLATRVAYKLDLSGPAYTVQTACSSSLVAIHLACEHLRNGDCDMALAGGVGIALPQTLGYLHREGMIFSPDGRCRPFDTAANGTGVGNGAGIVLLKRLEDAEADGDDIWGVIRGSAVNNDGATKVGFTAPSAQGQAAVIAEALAMAEVDPATIGLVEAHGTGTPLGDPVEVSALSRVYRRSTDRIGYCALGSVKSNLGHLDTAAGIASFLKALLALRNRAIPPTLNAETPNPALELDTSPFFLPDYALPWETEGTPRRAAVSSFGIGGTNCHVVLEEAPERAEDEGTPRSDGIVLPLGARSPASLSRLAGLIGDAIVDHSLPPADVAATLAHARGAQTFRAYPAHRDDRPLRDLTQTACIAWAGADALSAVRLAGGCASAAAAWLRQAARQEDDPFDLAALLPSAPAALRAWLDGDNAAPLMPASGLVLVQVALARWLIERVGSGMAVEADPAARLAVVVAKAGLTGPDLAARLASADDHPLDELPAWPAWPTDDALVIALVEASPSLTLQAIEAALWQAGLAVCPYPEPTRRVTLPATPFENRRLVRIGYEPIATTDDPTTSWSRLVAQVSDTARTLADTVDLARLEEDEATVSVLHRFHTAKAMGELACLPDGGWATLDEIMAAGRILPRFRQLTARLLDDLVAGGGLLRDAEGRYGRLAVPDGDDAREVDDRLDALAAAGDASLARLITRTAPRLGEVLAGRADPVEVMFARGDTDDAGDHYENHRYGLYFNRLTGAIAGHAARGASNGVSVLEVGAGTGGTTGAVREALGERCARYVFTDIGPLFVSRARAAYSHVAAMEFAVLDMERDVTAQGFEAGAFDMIIAANVLHNARSLPDMLANLRRLLRPGGVLVMREIVQRKPLFDITFGPLAPEVDGRDGALFANTELWRSAAREAGFAEAAAFPDPAEPIAALGEAVIVLRAPDEEAVASAPAGPKPARPVWQREVDGSFLASPASLLGLLIESASQVGFLPGSLEGVSLDPRPDCRASVPVQLSIEGETLCLHAGNGADQTLVACAIPRETAGAAPDVASVDDGPVPADRTEAIASLLEGLNHRRALTVHKLVEAEWSALRPGRDAEGGGVLVTRESYYPVLWLETAPLLRPADRDTVPDGRLVRPCWSAISLPATRVASVCILAADGDVMADGLVAAMQAGGSLCTRQDPRHGSLRDIPGDAALVLLVNGLLGPASAPIHERIEPLQAAIVTLARVARQGRPCLVASQGALAVQPDDTPAEPLAAAGLASALVAARETGAPIHAIDLDMTSASLDRLTGSIAAAAEPGQRLAIRNGQVLARRFAVLPWQPADAIPLATTGGVAMTGGLSRLGRTVLRWLGEAGAGEATLLTHRPPSAEEEADLAAIARETGLRIRMMPGVDSTRGDSVSAALAALERTPSLILHLAGVVRDGLLSEQDWTEASPVFATKLAAAEAMLAYARAHASCRVVFFSSLAAAYGPRGQAAHAAANAVLEAMAEKASSEGLKVQAIAWDHWRQSMRREHEHLIEHFRSAGLGNSEGLALLASALATSRPCLLAADPALFEERAQVGSSPARPADAGVADRTGLLAWLRAAVGDLIGRPADQVDVSAGLIQLGVDSLMFLDLSERTQADLDMQLSAETALGAESLLALAEAMDRERAGSPA